MNSEIFTEAFIARLLPMFHEVTLGAIRNLQFELYPANALLAGLGGLLALAVYYVVGVWLRRMPERVSSDEQRARIDAMRGAANEWLPWLLILSPTPVGGVVVMAAGFFRMRAAMVVVIATGSEMLFRAMPYLT